MFNLLQGIDWVDGRHSMSLSRIYPDKLPRPFSLEEFEKRGRLPTIVMTEGAPLSSESANFATLSEFEMRPREVHFSLRCEDTAMSFPASILNIGRYQHSLRDGWNWEHTCWQYGTGNIFETLYKSRAQLFAPNQPKIFSLRNPPKIEKDFVACMMPFAQEFDDVYLAIKVASASASLRCQRVDEIYNNKSIIGDVIDLIDRAGIVVCDLTGKNPNVLYEAGIAHAIGREVIIIAQGIHADVPFDLKHLRCTPAPELP